MWVCPRCARTLCFVSFFQQVKMCVCPQRARTLSTHSMTFVGQLKVTECVAHQHFGAPRLRNKTHGMTFVGPAESHGMCGTPAFWDPKAKKQNSWHDFGWAS